MRQYPASTPLVSVITPTLQRAAYLERTLRSIRAQEYPIVEHIVVDGGSTDGTIELLERYAGTYNLRWISEPDQGMYDAINKGLRMATGEVLAYLNSDDLYFPWTVEVAVDAFAGHPESAVVCGDTIWVDERHHRVVPVFVPPFSTLASAAYGAPRQPAILLRREVLDALGGFDTGLSYVADMEFWLRAARSFTFMHLREFMAAEHWHAAMLSESRRNEMQSEDEAMRARFRQGFAATRLGRVGAYLSWHVWSGLGWLGFVRATRGRATGWSRTIAACHPHVDSATAALGLIPSRGSQLRGVTWARDPSAVASGEASD